MKLFSIGPVSSEAAPTFVGQSYRGKSQASAARPVGNNDEDNNSWEQIPRAASNKH